MPAVPRLTIVDVPPPIAEISSYSDGIVSCSIVIEAGAESRVVASAQVYHTCCYQQPMVYMYALMESWFITQKGAICVCSLDHGFSVHIPIILEHGYRVIKIVH